MPIYRPLVPNGHSDSPQMISGSGLELSGGKFSLKDLAKGVGKAANVAIPLAQAFGVEGADQAAAVNDAIQGNGFGKGTQRKMLAAAKKGARVADKLIDEFGDEKKSGRRTRPRRSQVSFRARALRGTLRLRRKANNRRRRRRYGRWLTVVVSPVRRLVA